MAETEESAMEDKNNITSHVTSGTDTEAELQEAEPKRGTGIPLFGFGLGLMTKH